MVILNFKDHDMKIKQLQDKHQYKKITNDPTEKKERLINRKLHIRYQDILVSFDVTDLFTNVPTSETFQIIRQRLLNDNSLPLRTNKKIDAIMELMTICLQSTYFQYNKEFYEQTDNLAMGSPPSLILADIFMEDFEERALSSTPINPSFYRRYVNDTFFIWPHGHEKLPVFLEHLNSVDKRIHFTMEIEEQNRLPFVDILIIRQERKITTTVYRKLTHTNR
ncbi:uncharacterized protein LOC106457696 [Limulus polyphemus]|uniref:Uncharacterized protein LOC106457696 n=1 Tax=Limulus polyphemus TaxID=6850 RepID=A0ABM1B113_LIMPO|nr:uncharacterized protein LOC106457696 [Limulus polyphemus]